MRAGSAGSDLEDACHSFRAERTAVAKVLCGAICLGAIAASGTEITANVNGDIEISPPGGESLRTIAAPMTTAILAAGSGTGNQADPTVAIKSDPDGGEIITDGKFVGNTPSTGTPKSTAV